MKYNFYVIYESKEKVNKCKHHESVYEIVIIKHHLIKVSLGLL